MRRFVVAVVGAVVSLGYWTLVAAVGFVAGSGDVAPSTPPPSAGVLQGRTVAVAVVAIVVHALGSLLWRWLEARLLGPISPRA